MEVLVFLSKYRGVSFMAEQKKANNNGKGHCAEGGSESEGEKREEGVKRGKQLKIDII